MLQVDVVSAERRLFQGEVAELYARSIEGEIGILPGHEATLLALDYGPIRLKMPDGSQIVIAVHRRGFLECRDDQINVLADIAEMVEEIDIERAERALERGRRHLETPGYEGDALSEIQRAELRIKLGRSGGVPVP